MIANQNQCKINKYWNQSREIAPKLEFCMCTVQLLVLILFKKIHCCNTSIIANSLIFTQPQHSIQSIPQVSPYSQVMIDTKIQFMYI